MPDVVEVETDETTINGDKIWITTDRMGFYVLTTKATGAPIKAFEDRFTGIAQAKRALAQYVETIRAKRRTKQVMREGIEKRLAKQGTPIGEENGSRPNS